MLGRGARQDRHRLGGRSAGRPQLGSKIRCGATGPQHPGLFAEVVRPQRDARPTDRCHGPAMSQRFSERATLDL